MLSSVPNVLRAGPKLWTCRQYPPAAPAPDRRGPESKPAGQHDTFGRSCHSLLLILRSSGFIHDFRKRKQQSRKASALSLALPLPVSAYMPSSFLSIASSHRCTLKDLPRRSGRWQSRLPSLARRGEIDSSLPMPRDIATTISQCLEISST